MASNQQVYVGVISLLRRGNKVYLVERNPDFPKNDKHKSELECPGGTIDPGETIVEAAIREANEETLGFLHLRYGQFGWWGQYVDWQAADGKWIRLYEVDIDASQEAQLWQAKQRLVTQRKTHPAKNEMCDLHQFDLIDLKKENLPLPLRNHNKTLIDLAKSAGMLRIESDPIL